MAWRTEVLSSADGHLLATAAPDLFDDPLDARRTREFLDDPRHHLIVGLDGSTIVGFVSAVHYVHPDKPSPELWINEVSVAPDHRRRGVGRAMMERTLSLAAALGCSSVWVLTDRDNPAAMRLYAGSGGVEAPKPQVMFEFDVGAGARGT